MPYEFIIARTARGRPTLQHRMSDDRQGRTQCGLDVRFWSRAYQDHVIPQIICLKCKEHRP